MSQIIYRVTITNLATDTNEDEADFEDELDAVRWAEEQAERIVDRLEDRVDEDKRAVFVTCPRDEGELHAYLVQWHASDAPPLYRVAVREVLVDNEDEDGD